MSSDDFVFVRPGVIRVKADTLRPSVVGELLRLADEAENTPLAGVCFELTLEVLDE
jgi:hypothetical protein